MENKTDLAQRLNVIKNVTRNLADCSFEDKHLALDDLGIKIIATPDKFEIQGTIPLEANSKLSTNAHSSR